MGNAGCFGDLRLAVWGGMVNYLIKQTLTLAAIALLCFVFFELGESQGKKQAKIEIITKEIEVIKYVEKKRAEIHSQPNAGRDTLLERMRAGVL